MKIELNEIVVAAMAAALLLGIASAHAGEALLGKVRGVYVEVQRGVIVEESAKQAPEGARRWADVDFGAHGAQPRRHVMVQLAPEMKAEQGDLVEVKLAGRDASPMLLPQTNRATLIAAKWFTPQAGAFDRAPLAALLFK
jgi:hypothetical protein